MSYPERPPRPGPKKPSKGKGRPSSEHIAGKRKIRIVKVTAADTAPKGPREQYDKLAFSVSGHNNPKLDLFLKQNRYNRVPLHKWGTKGRTLEA